MTRAFWEYLMGFASGAIVVLVADLFVLWHKD